MDQTQRPRYVSRFELLALHPRVHHRVGFPIHYLPPREPPPRRICYNNRSTELLSQTPPHNRGVGPLPNNNQHLYRRGFTNQTPPLTNGSKPITRSTSTKEGYNKSKGVQLGGYNNLKLTLFSLFHKTNDPNRLG